MKKPINLLALLLALFFSLTTLNANTIKSGMIEYEINGNGQMMGITTKTIGKKTLYFKDYGTIIVEEEQRSDMVNEAALEDSKTHTLRKIINNAIYDVDFKNRKITKSINLEGNHSLITDKNKIKNGRKIGSDIVLGYLCEVWAIDGIKQCLYRGQFPLWIEKTDKMGVKTKVIAIKAQFNKPLPNEKFELPKYSIELLPMHVSEKKRLKESKQVM